MAAQAPGRYPSHMTLHLDNLQEAVDLLLQRIPGTLRIGAPLGIGKPHRLLNALYERAEADPSRPLSLYTALSLDPPRGHSLLEQRFLGPFVARLYGAGFPRLSYVEAQKRDALAQRDGSDRHEEILDHERGLGLRQVDACQR